MVQPLRRLRPHIFFGLIPSARGPCVDRHALNLQYPCDILRDNPRMYGALMMRDSPVLWWCVIHRCFDDAWFTSAIIYYFVCLYMYHSPNHLVYLSRTFFSQIFCQSSFIKLCPANSESMTFNTLPRVPEATLSSCCTMLLRVSISLTLVSAMATTSTGLGDGILTRRLGTNLARS